MTTFKGTTICAVKRDGVTAIAGDGQVTMGESVVFKGNAVKVKRIYNDKVVLGFAGTVSDAFALSENLKKCCKNTAETLCVPPSNLRNSGAMTRQGNWKR